MLANSLPSIIYTFSKGLNFYFSLYKNLNKLSDILIDFRPISLQEMDEVRLLNRVDSKYVMSKSQFYKTLPQLVNDYKVLTIDSLRSANYKSLYFDTEDFKYYNDHHNGKVNRHKVRTRKYLDSELCFFEIKHKTKGRTDKKRIRIEDFNREIEGKSHEFLDQIIEYSPDLKPCLWNSFERVTLVNNERKERLTFDIGLNFSWDEKDFGFDDIVIAEVKQEINARNIPCRRLFKSMLIREKKISKYCIGMGLLYKNLKTNRFKEKYLMIKKIQNNV